MKHQTHRARNPRANRNSYHPRKLRTSCSAQRYLSIITMICRKTRRSTFRQKRRISSTHQIDRKPANLHRPDIRSRQTHGRHHQQRISRRHRRRQPLPSDSEDILKWRSKKTKKRNTHNFKTKKTKSLLDKGGVRRCGRRI